MAENVALAALHGLRTLLGSQPTLRVIASDGHSWDAGFAFGPPAAKEQMDTAERELGACLPAVYREFLVACDGALLYQAVDVGGVGATATRASLGRH